MRTITKTRIVLLAIVCLALFASGRALARPIMDVGDEEATPSNAQAIVEARIRRDLLKGRIVYDSYEISVTCRPEARRRLECVGRLTLYTAVSSTTEVRCYTALLGRTSAVVARHPCEAKRGVRPIPRWVLARAEREIDWRVRNYMSRKIEKITQLKVLASCRRMSPRRAVCIGEAWYPVDPMVGITIDTPYYRWCYFPKIGPPPAWATSVDGPDMRACAAWRAT